MNPIFEDEAKFKAMLRRAGCPPEYVNLPSPDRITDFAEFERVGSRYIYLKADPEDQDAAAWGIYRAIAYDTGKFPCKFPWIGVIQDSVNDYKEWIQEVVAKSSDWWIIDPFWHPEMDVYTSCAQYRQMAERFSYFLLNSNLRNLHIVLVSSSDLSEIPGNFWPDRLLMQIRRKKLLLDDYAPTA